jgi:hypothetical protein
MKATGTWSFPEYRGMKSLQSIHRQSGLPFGRELIAAGVGIA